MSTVFARLAAIRDYWMPRNLDARIEVRVTDIDAILHELVRVTTLAADREAELETERMRLAACGVVALSNTAESAAEARKMSPAYWSASCGDVAAAVDEQMRLRAALAEAQKDAARLDFLTERPDLTLRTQRRKRWLCYCLTNYDIGTFDTPREAIDAAMQEGEQ